MKRDLLWEFAYINIPEEDVTIRDPKSVAGKWWLTGEATKGGQSVRHAVRERGA